MTSLALARLARAPVPTLIRTLALAAAVALLGSMLLFVGHSLRTMTAGAVRNVPLDWQAPVSSFGAAVRAARDVGRQPDVRAAAPVATAPFAGIEHTSPAGTIRAGTGAILAVPPDYPAELATFHLLRGSLSPNGVVLDQQLAATLQAQPGDTIVISPRPAAAGRRFRVSGVALVGAADVLFQPLIPLLGPAPAQPPANIAILPLAAFAARFAPGFSGRCRHRSIRTRSPAAPRTPPGSRRGSAIASSGRCPVGSSLSTTSQTT
jgi:MacB-like protein